MGSSRPRGRPGRFGLTSAEGMVNVIIRGGLVAAKRNRARHVAGPLNVGTLWTIAEAVRPEVLARLAEKE